MIINRKPMTLAAAKSMIKNLDEKKELNDYMKKFSSLTSEKAEKLFNEIKALNSHKLKDESIVKIVDFLPKDSEDLNKLLPEAGFSEEESNVIIEIIKKY